MATLEKWPDGRIQLNVMGESEWERHLFENMQELEIYCHKNGMVITDANRASLK